MKHITIETCKECPCRMYEGVCEDGSYKIDDKYRWFCGAYFDPSPSLDDVVIDLNTIPTWCPLEDY